MRMESGSNVKTMDYPTLIKKKMLLLCEEETSMQTVSEYIVVYVGNYD